MNTRVSRLNESEIEEAAHVLGRAFFDDPLETYVLPEDMSRVQLSTERFKNVVRYGHLFGDVFVTSSERSGEISGVAMWLRPNDWEMTDERMSQAGMFALPSIIGQEAFGRFIPVLDYVDEFHHSDVPPAHWYLLLLGVDPSVQRGGIGRSLLAPMLDRADAEGLSCYLETSNEQNLVFYQRQGFAVAHEVTEPSSGVRMWTMRRDKSRRAVV